jgi:glycogen debranching enzyme
MKRIALLLITLARMPFLEAQPVSPVSIGLVTEGLSSGEEKAVVSFLRHQKDLQAIPVPLNTLSAAGLRAAHITHIWWLKDSEMINEQEEKAGAALKAFVAGGGHLILSMEAVRLLNAWGIEKNKFEVREDSVIDEGFGRPLGFHGYQDHPVYEGLHGGAYPWKGKTDHVVRKIGFFHTHLPDTSIARVIGIGWSYITFHEDEKLVLEYRLGKGSVIAVGAYTYFSRPNFNTTELYRFYRNIFNYTSGKIQGIKKGYWAYHEPAVVETDNRIDPVKPAAATTWKLPPLTLQLQRREATGNFVNLAGRRMLLMGKERGGIQEIWTHPFMAFRDIETGIRTGKADSLVWLSQLIPEITVSPEMLIRKYVIGVDTLREIITVDFDKPVGVLHYEWTGHFITQIRLKFTSNLRPMWPYSDTSSPVMHYQWSKAIGAAVISNPHAGSQAILGFSNFPGKHLLGRYKSFEEAGENIKATGTKLEQVSGYFSFDAGALNGRFNVYMIGDAGSVEDAIALYKKVMPGLNNLYKASSDYYNKLLRSQLTISTPDAKFNEGYRWAMLRTDQFLQTTPGIGTSMMAGFGTTATGWNGRQAVSGRPGYAWYFGRDGEWEAMALDALGGFEKAREVLDMLAKFQAVNGKILHELTSSGAVHYDAADATPLFVVLAAHYLRYSGDTGYIRKLWPAIQKAMDFCYSTDTDHDGLIENTNVGHGWIEGGPLFGSHTEFYLAGSWAAALDGAAYISKWLGLPGPESRYAADARQVKEIIDRDFWSKEGAHFYNGKMPDGSYMKDATVLQAVPVLLNAVTDPQKAWQATGAFARNNFSSSWGVRMIPDDNPKFDPGAYHAGMVWPLFNGYASLAEYKTGHYTAGFTHMMDNILGYDAWALGSIVETLNGKNDRPNGVCSLQGWSETMCIQPAIEGMLGYAPDAMARRLTVSPCFPGNWNAVTVDKLRFGKTKFKMTMNRSEGRYDYVFEKKDAGTIHLDFNPVLPYGTRISRVLVNDQKAGFTPVVKGEGVKINIASLHFTHTLRITVYCTVGADALPLINAPQP